MNDAIKKHLSVILTTLICLCYCHFVPSRIPKGWFRLISILPILCLFTVLPLHLPPIFFSIMAVTIVQWLSIFRLILFAFGEGPLSPPQSLHSFIISGVFPTRNPSSKLPPNYSDSNSIRKKPLTVVAEFFGFGVFISILVNCGHDLRSYPKLQAVSYAGVTMLCMICVAHCTEFVFHAVLGKEMEPMFDKPYLTTSFQDFWGKRWNLIVSNLLGRVVHKPVRTASAVCLGNDLCPIPAHLLTFLVSGLMHELMLYGITRSNPSGEMTGFFVVYGIGMVLEFYVKKASKGRLSLPWFVSWTLTTGLLSFASVWILWPLIIREGVDQKVYEEIQWLTQFLHT